jgi:hypothetical protein
MVMARLPAPLVCVITPPVVTVVTSPAWAVPAPNASVVKDTPGIWTVAAEVKVAP